MKRGLKRWIAFVALFYPKSWREEFGDEFNAVLDDVRPDWRVLSDVLRGAIEMRVISGTNWLKMTGAMAALGAIVAGGLSFTVAPRYVSSAVLSVTPQADPVRPMSPEVFRQRAAAHIAEMENEILSRRVLYAIVKDPRLELYREELKRPPLDAAAEQMQRDLRIQTQSSPDGELLVSISFAYSDQAKAQAAVMDLATRFVKLNQDTDSVRTGIYRSFWGEMSARDGRPAAPPPPVGEIVRVVNAPRHALEKKGPIV